MRTLVLTSLFTLVTAVASAASLPLEERSLDIDKAVRDQNGTYVSACEARQAPLRKELAEIVDQLIGRVKLTEDDFKEDGIEFIKVGPALFRQRAANFKPKRIDPQFSWDTVYGEYLELAIKESKNSKAWFYFTKDVSYLVDLDEENLIYHTPNLYLGSPAKYSETISLLKKCLVDPTCFITGDEAKQLKDFGTSLNAYSFPIWQITRIEERKWQEPSMRDLLEELENFYKERFGFRKNPGIKRVSANEIVLPLDPGQFAGAEAQLAGYIEGLWNSPTLKVRIEWTSQVENPKAFRFEHEKDFTKRSFVRYSENLIRISSYSRTSTLSHEIGHVLGFSDFYFSPRKNPDCTYRDDSDTNDIMSDSTTGKVTAEEWAELDRQYPYVAPNQ